MNESDLRAEAQTLADMMDAKGFVRPVGIALLLSAVWDLAQREFPGDLVAAKQFHRRALQSHKEKVSALRGASAG